MRRTLGDIALMLGAKVTGDPATVIESLSGLEEAEVGSLVFVSDPKLAAKLGSTRAAAALVSESIAVGSDLPHIRVKDAGLAMLDLADRVAAEAARPRPGRHPTAVVGRGAVVGRNVSIGAYVVVDEEAEIADQAVLHPHCVVGRKAKIGAESVLHARVTVGDRCVLGRRVILHPGVVIGADGFGYVETGGGKRRKIPQLGIVEIGDEVEIGANSTVDRARFGRTSIGRGTKIDNLVHVGHGVRIGENCILLAQVGIAGSTVIGDGVVLAGQVGVSDHRRIGAGAQVGAKSAVLQDVPDGAKVSGIPAHDHAGQLREQAALKRLPDVLRRLRELERRGGAGAP